MESETQNVAFNSDRLALRLANPRLVNHCPASFLNVYATTVVKQEATLLAMTGGNDKDVSSFRSRIISITEEASYPTPAGFSVETGINWEVYWRWDQR